MRRSVGLYPIGKLTRNVEWGETNREVDVKVKIVDEDEKDVVIFDMKMTTGRPAQAKLGQDIRSIIAMQGPIRMLAAGAYKAVMALNDVAQEPPFRFWLEQVEVPMSAQRGQDG